LSTLLFPIAFAYLMVLFLLSVKAISDAKPVKFLELSAENKKQSVELGERDYLTGAVKTVKIEQSPYASAAIRVAYRVLKNWNMYPTTFAVPVLLTMLHGLFGIGIAEAGNSFPVSSSNDFRIALTWARDGDEIVLAPGVYTRDQAFFAIDLTGVVIRSKKHDDLAILRVDADEGLTLRSPKLHCVML